MEQDPYRKWERTEKAEALREAIRKAEASPPESPLWGKGMASSPKAKKDALKHGVAFPPGTNLGETPPAPPQTTRIGTEPMLDDVARNVGDQLRAETGYPRKDSVTLPKTEVAPKSSTHLQGASTKTIEKSTDTPDTNEKSKDDVGPAKTSAAGNPQKTKEGGLHISDIQDSAKGDDDILDLTNKVSEPPQEPPANKEEVATTAHETSSEDSLRERGISKRKERCTKVRCRVSARF